MKTLMTGLCLMAGLALSVQAGEVLLWQDNFTGVDGTIVAPSANWGYTNLGVLLTSWSNTTRPDANDQYVIAGNQLSCFINPCTNSTYQKLHAAFRPLSDGTPVFLVLTNGHVEAEFDLTAVTANLGNQWGLNQELKLALAAGPTMQDPDAYTNMYYVKLTVAPSNTPTVRIAASYASVISNKNAELPSANFTVAYPLVAPLKLKMLVKSDATYEVYTNGVPWVATNSAIPAASMQALYPFFWQGKFNGAGPFTDGKMFLDNFVVKSIPEPLAGVALLLAVALARRTRG